MNVKSVEEAVGLAVDQAIMADAQGTFSVGGILIDMAGNVVHSIHNNVVRDKLVYDPTAHGERQLIDWYYENREALQLPEPQRMIIVTSLDPCAMCTGAILSSGFHLVIISALDQFAGINYNGRTNLPTFDGYPQMKSAALSKFAYAKIDGVTRVSRPASGAYIKMFAEDAKSIEGHTGMLSSTVFESTVGKVQETINGDAIPEDRLEDLKLEGSSNWVYREVKSRFPEAFEYKAPSPQDPDEGILPFISRASMEDVKNGGDGNCVAFLDYFGNLIFCMAGRQNLSPIQTAFMRATRLYAQLRYDIGTRSSNSLRYLCHPKYGSFIYRKKPIVSPGTLMNMGAYGSTMEGEIPNGKPLQYIEDSNPGDEVQDFINQMPPFYTQTVQIKISQVTNLNLRNKALT